MAGKTSTVHVLLERGERRHWRAEARRRHLTLAELVRQSVRETIRSVEPAAESKESANG